MGCDRSSSASSRVAADQRSNQLVESPGALRASQPSEDSGAGPERGDCRISKLGDVASPMSAADWPRPSPGKGTRALWNGVAAGPTGLTRTGKRALPDSVTSVA